MKQEEFEKKFKEIGEELGKVFQDFIKDNPDFSSELFDGKGWSYYIGGIVKDNKIMTSHCVEKNIVKGTYHIKFTTDNDLDNKCADSLTKFISNKSAS